MIERKIIKIGGHKGRLFGTMPGYYSSWTIWVDIRSSENDSLTHEELYDIIKPHLLNQWPNMNINRGACSGGKPANPDGTYDQDKDFYVDFKTEQDEAEFILEHDILVGRIL